MLYVIFYRGVVKSQYVFSRSDDSLWEKNVWIVRNRMTVNISEPGKVQTGGLVQTNRTRHKIVR